VRAYWMALERGEPGVFNVCSGRSTAVSDILTGLAAHSSLDVECRIDPSRLRNNEVMEIRGSHEKLTKATGWQPEIELADTLRDALDWWRERVAAGVAQ
jgi:GDP-4-dehydro-6-deoxy-D-mannose reductase